MMKKISGLALGLHPIIKHKKQLGLDKARPIYGPSLALGFLCTRRQSAKQIQRKNIPVRLYDIHEKCKLSRMPESLDKYHYPIAKVISIRLSDR